MTDATSDTTVVETMNNSAPVTMSTSPTSSGNGGGANNAGCERLLKKLNNIESTIHELLSLQMATPVLEKKLCQLDELILDIPDEEKELTKEWRLKVSGWWKKYAAAAAGPTHAPASVHTAPAHPSPGDLTNGGDSLRLDQDAPTDLLRQFANFLRAKVDNNGEENMDADIVKSMGGDKALKKSSDTRSEKSISKSKRSSENLLALEASINKRGRRTQAARNRSLTSRTLSPPHSWCSISSAAPSVSAAASSFCSSDSDDDADFMAVSTKLTRDSVYRELTDIFDALEQVQTADDVEQMRDLLGGLKRARELTKSYGDEFNMQDRVFELAFDKLSSRLRDTYSKLYEHKLVSDLVNFLMEKADGWRMQRFPTLPTRVFVSSSIARSSYADTVAGKKSSWTDLDASEPVARDFVKCTVMPSDIPSEKTEMEAFFKKEFGRLTEVHTSADIGALKALHTLTSHAFQTIQNDGELRQDYNLMSSIFDVAFEKLSPEMRVAFHSKLYKSGKLIDLAKFLYAQFTSKEAEKRQEWGRSSSSSFACFKCNKPGHLLRNCPTMEKRERVTSKMCFRCGGDHLVHNCPSLPHK